jgi:hypothetical protein
MTAEWPPRADAPSSGGAAGAAAVKSPPPASGSSPQLNARNRSAPQSDGVAALPSLRQFLDEVQLLHAPAVAAAAAAAAAAAVGHGSKLSVPPLSALYSTGLPSPTSALPVVWPAPTAAELLAVPAARTVAAASRTGSPPHASSVKRAAVLPLAAVPIEATAAATTTTTTATTTMTTTTTTTSTVAAADSKGSASSGGGGGGGGRTIRWLRDESDLVRQRARGESSGSRNAYPTAVTQELLGWVRTHPASPYPSAEQKATLVEATGLSHGQVVTWFCNLRKRGHAALTGDVPELSRDHFRSSSPAEEAGAAAGA